MASEPTQSRPSTNDLGAIKRKLAWRMGFAGLMIIGLLGGLALFDRLSVRSPEPDAPAPQFTEPVPVGKKSLTQPVTPPETTASSPAAGAPEASAAPIDKSVAPSDPPPRPEVAAQPALPRAATSAAPAPRAVAAGKASEAKAAAVPAPRAEAAGAQPPAAAVASPVPAAAPRPLFGYALQAGVFADPRRAEELHARLVLEGIPSTIEARVHAGPFKNRAEADAARAKLKKMGIDVVLLAPKAGKR